MNNSQLVLLPNFAQYKLDVSFNGWPSPARSTKWPWTTSLHHLFPALDLLLQLLAEKASHISYIYIPYLPK